MESGNVWGDDARVALVAALAGLSFTASAVLWAVFVRPLDTGALQGFNDPDYLGLVVLVPFVGAAAVAYAVYAAPKWVVVFAVLAPSVVVGGVSYAYHDELAWQREAREVFDRYTHRFPPGELGDPDIAQQHSAYMDVCAVQSSRRRGLRFCLEIDAADPEGREVQGGYRYDAGQAGEVGIIGARRFDCFGVSAEVC